MWHLVADTDQTLCVGKGCAVLLKVFATIVCVQKDMRTVLADSLEDLQRWLHIPNMKHWQLQLNVPCTTEAHACPAEASSCSTLKSV